MHHFPILALLSRSHADSTVVLATTFRDNSLMDSDRSWIVLLLGGASGVGKSRVSHRLARHYEIGITEVDDFQAVLEHMTTPEQYPPLHLWRLHPDEFLRLDDEGKLRHMLNCSRVISEALSYVIANHLESRAPILLEGDFILPALAVRRMYSDIPADGRVRSVFLYEPDEAQLRANFLQREADNQPVRARASHRHGKWLRHECERLGVPCVMPRPWNTVLERVIAAVDAP